MGASDVGEWVTERYKQNCADTIAFFNPASVGKKVTPVRVLQWCGLGFILFLVLVVACLVPADDPMNSGYGSGLYDSYGDQTAPFMEPDGSFYSGDEYDSQHFYGN